MELRFGLVINFEGRDKAAHAVQAALAGDVVRLRGVDLRMPPPSVHDVRGANGKPYTQVFIQPGGIGHAPTGPILPVELQEIADDDLLRLGEQLYGLLRRLDGYVAALVGWNPEPLVEVDEPGLPWLTNGNIYLLNGLVVSAEVADRWQVDSRFVPFAHGYRWLPYEGRRSLT